MWQVALGLGGLEPHCVKGAVDRVRPDVLPMFSHTVVEDQPLFADTDQALGRLVAFGAVALDQEVEDACGFVPAFGQADM